MKPVETSPRCHTIHWTKVKPLQGISCCNYTVKGWNSRGYLTMLHYTRVKPVQATIHYTGLKPVERLAQDATLYTVRRWSHFRLVQAAAVLYTAQWWLSTGQFMMLHYTRVKPVQATVHYTEMKPVETSSRCYTIHCTKVKPVQASFWCHTIYYTGLKQVKTSSRC